MAELSKEIKLFIVQCLACYDTPSQVAESVKEEFGITLERQNVMRYDPNKQSGKTLSAELRTVFEQTREAFANESMQIPIASKIFRLRALQRQYEYFISRKNYVQARAVLDQAGKESGGYYNAKQPEGGDGMNLLLALIQQVQGSALPVYQDVGKDEIFDGQLVDSAKEEDKPVKAKKLIVERD
jgi:hypothetical protein